MKTKVTFFLSVLFLFAAVTMPAFSLPGSGEWPCSLSLVLRDGVWDLDCLFNSGECLCSIFLY